MSRTLSSAQVMRRMRQGDQMYLHGWGNSKGIFDDGAKVSSRVIRHLLGSGKIDRPEHTSVHSPYRLAEQKQETI